MPIFKEFVNRNDVNYFLRLVTVPFNFVLSPLPELASETPLPFPESRYSYMPKLKKSDTDHN